MAVLSGKGDLLTFQRQTLDKLPQDVRTYWTPERKKVAIPAHRAPSVAVGTSAPDGLDVPMPDAAVASLVTQILTSLVLPCYIRQMRPNARLMAEAFMLRGIRLTRGE